jgi:glucose-6-phosphate 1-dehydrogenase
MNSISTNKPEAAPDFDMVIFGGTGDLAARKLIPGLFKRFRAGDIGSESGPSAAFRIVCLGHRAGTTESFRTLITEKVAAFVDIAGEFKDDWAKFLPHIQYVSVDATNVEHYVALGQTLRNDARVIRAFYLSTPPDLFTAIIENLSAAKLTNENTRLVLEKPLGNDYASARAINKLVRKHFSESQVFRIDHYLGKETVQNLLALRFGNVLFEPLWRREWVSDVQITIAEEIGVGTRAGFYDQTGALRDMLQNHLLQLLCIVAMEPPVSLSADAVRDEKLKVLKALRPFTQEDLNNRIVRGVYRAGTSAGVKVPGYHEEQGVAPESTTETYVAIKAEINTWRWAGVPFFLRSGKRMPERSAEILVRFRKPPYSIFVGERAREQPNELLIRLQPDEGLELRMMAKTPGEGMRLKEVPLKLDFDEAFKTPTMEAYERLLMDVIRNQLTLFTRADELEAAWMWLQPVLDHWATDAEPPRPYNAGTWGPPAASALTGRDDVLWREES